MWLQESLCVSKWRFKGWSTNSSILHGQRPSTFTDKIYYGPVSVWKIVLFYCKDLFVCLWVWGICVSANGSRTHKRASNSWRLELQTPVSCHVGAETEPWSFGEVASTLNSQAIFLLPPPYLVLNKKEIHSWTHLDTHVLSSFSFYSLCWWPCQKRGGQQLKFRCQPPRRQIPDGWISTRQNPETTDSWMSFALAVLLHVCCYDISQVSSMVWMGVGRSPLPVM